MAWDGGRLRREARFGDRVVPFHADRPASLLALFRQAVTEGGARDAVVAGERRICWDELDTLSGGVAARLIEAGVGRGDRVALLLGNGIPFVVAAIGITRIGGVIVPISIREQRAEIVFLLAHSGAAVAIHGPEVADQLPSAAECPDVRLWAEQSGPLFSGGEGRVPDFDIDEDEIAIIFYTSGTTGRPKGAMLTHANIVHSALNYVHCMELGPADRTIVAVPMSHVTGLVGLIATALCARGALVVMASFAAPDFVALAAAERATHTIMVPAMYNLLLLRTDLAAADLGAWRIGGYGGAPMPAATIERLAETLPGLGLWNVYGATETASPTTILPPRCALSHRDSVGLVVPGGSIVVMDGDGREVASREIGELWIGGAMVVPGYWNDPGATAANFVGGYWKSGDIGSVDDAGFVRIFDRAKDMVNRGGYKIYSAEVEAVLAGHLAIMEAAVVPRPCPVLGERVHAFVVLREGVDLDTAALDAFASEHLADFKRPESWTIGRDPLPRNANGKVLKRLLKEMVDAA